MDDTDMKEEDNTQEDKNNDEPSQIIPHIPHLHTRRYGRRPVILPQQPQQVPPQDEKQDMDTTGGYDYNGGIGWTDGENWTGGYYTADSGYRKKYGGAWSAGAIKLFLYLGIAFVVLIVIAIIYYSSKDGFHLGLKRKPKYYGSKRPYGRHVNGSYR